jgi:hypothetical protein
LSDPSLGLVKIAAAIEKANFLFYPMLHINSTLYMDIQWVILGYI